MARGLYAVSSLWVTVPPAFSVGAGVVLIHGDCCGGQGTMFLLLSLQRHVILE